MDYVKETLQRQNGLWLALFGGGEKTEAAEAQQEQILRERTLTEQMMLHSGDFPREETREERVWERGSARAQEELLLRGRESLLRELAFRRREDAESDAARTESRAQKMEVANAELARWEAEAAMREGRSDLETADARAISRRFERDARRYDGGFVFY